MPFLPFRPSREGAISGIQPRYRARDSEQFGGRVARGRKFLLFARVRLTSSTRGARYKINGKCIFQKAPDTQIMGNPPVSSIRRVGKIQFFGPGEAI